MPTVASPSDNPFFTEFLDDFFAECDEHLTVIRHSLLLIERFVGRPRVELDQGGGLLWHELVAP